ncbi:MAG: hypothetical protein IMY74_00990 [Bacteroidetes bacterium]|nr:hypothetical protein [Bacteroidota bacterium]
MPKERLIVFQRGHKVGELAQELFPGGVNMSPGHPAAFRKALVNTQEKIKEGFPVIYEAAFQHDQVMIFLDILVHTGSGWHAYEVKSSGGISDTYLLDAALQYHVITGTGIKLSGISLVHINKEYVLGDEVDLKGLFKIIDVTEEALSRRKYVTEQIIREKEALGLEHSPKIDVGPHCREPYDCDFLGHCWKNVPVPPEKEPKDQINAEAFRKVFSDLPKDAAFVKLLPMRAAIPMYRGTHPYQEIAYGYGLMINGKTSARIFGNDSNPEEQLKTELKSAPEGISTLICFGQGHKLRNLMPGGVDVLDLRDHILKDSSFYTSLKDKSDLERLKIIFGLEKDKKLSEYVSDAIAEHYYLKDFPDEGVEEKIEEYASSYLQTIHDLYSYLRSI